jgi:hypothetical protein
VTAGFYPLSGNPSGFLTASSLTPYLSKAGNLTGLTDLSAARDNLNLGTSNTPVFAGVTAQGSAGNIAQLTPTSLTLTQAGSGIFTIQPSQGIVFPDTTVQTTAYPGPVGATQWGSIGGTLSNQTDLYNSLAAKLDSTTAASTYAVIAAGQPASGTVGQVLTKQSGANYDSNWATLIPGDRYLTSSTTSLTIDNANKTLTVGTGLSYTTQQDAIIAYDAAHHMHVRVTAYNSSTGQLDVDVISHTGTGTYAAWTVNVGGTVPLASIVWGDILGTLGNQGDLATALSNKLETSTAASTYYLQTNPDGFITSSALTGYATETFVTTQGYITQGTADGLYYPLSGNPLAFLTAGNLAPYAELAGAAFTGPISTSDTVTVGSFNPDPTPTANGQIWYNQLLGVLRYYDGTSTKSVASQAWASNAFYPISGNPSAFLVAADITGKANLASPTFTGTPTLPTGTIATTQTAGDNTTAVATTAFVTAAVPAFATIPQTIAGTSTTTSLSPALAPSFLTHPECRPLAYFKQTAVSGSGGVTASTVDYGAREMFLSTLAVGRAGWMYGITGANIPNMSRADWRKVDFSKKIWLSGRAMAYSTTAFGSSYPGDANTFARITLGGYSTNTTGDMTLLGIGWKKQGGLASFYTLTVHNGTTRTDVATTVSATDNSVIDWVLYSEGNGNVSFYINGTLAASTAAGPTGITASYAGMYREQVEAATTPTARQILETTGGWLYMEA